jgi:F0F1-type ATP synthase membrane subunit b/b'
MIERLRRLGELTVIFSLLILSAAPAFAAEQDQSPADTTVGWVFRWLNFAVVFGGLAYLLAKYTPPFFRGRAEAIVSAINDAARALEDAEQQLRDAEAKLAGLEQEIAELRATARRDAATEAERIRTLAREETHKIERAAQAEIQAAERAARMELKVVAARLAVERAEALLRQEMTPRTQSTLFRDFLDSLARSTN